MITTISFAGFYYTLHNEILDDGLRGLFTDEQGDINWKLYNKAFDLIQWQEVFVEYAQDYAERFAEEFNVKMVFESLSSPKEYNFTTDRIFCTINLEEIMRIYAATDKDCLSGLIKDKFTSRDGFSSFYSNDLEAWGDVSAWDHNQLGTLLECYTNQETNNTEGFTSLEEYYIMEDARGNGYIENWLFENVKDEEAFERYIKISRYLSDREQR